jgi:hypothetical protein
MLRFRGLDYLMVRSLLECLTYVDSVSSYIQLFEAKTRYADLTSLASRYYIVVHDVLYPVAVELDTPLTLRVFLEPITTLYIQENKIYAHIRLNYLENHFRDLDLSKIPVINVDENEKLSILAAISIADKIVSMPSERSLLKVLPGNLRTYIEAAIDMLRAGNKKENSIVRQEGGKQRKILEYVLWLSRSPHETIKEIDYVLGLTTKALQIRYTAFDIEVKSSTKTGFAEAVNYIERLLPINTLMYIERNTTKAQKIIGVAASMI